MKLFAFAFTISICSLALSACQQPIDLSPEQEIAMADSKELSELLQRYSNQIDARPNWQSYSRRAKVYERTNKPAWALADYGNAIQLNPNNADLYAGRAEIEHKQHASQLALWDLGQALKLRPHHYNTLLDRARVFQDLKQYDKALVDLDDAIAHPVPDRMVSPMAIRAMVHELNGEYDKALADYTTVINTDKNKDSGLNALGDRASTYAKHGDKKHALEDYLKLTDARGDYDTCKYVAEELDKLGLKEEANRVRQKAKPPTY